MLNRSLKPLLGESQTLCHSINWSDNSLGPSELWPELLKLNLNFIFQSKIPMILYWGPDLINFYNDAFIPSLPGKHPGAMGMKGMDVWKEVWPQIESKFVAALLTDKPIWYVDELLPVLKNGLLENIYWTYVLSPVCDESGKAQGVMVIFQKINNEQENEEKSKKSISDFKLASLGMMAAEIAHEINNPLAVLKTSCKVLDMMAEEEPFPKLAMKIKITEMSDTITRISKIVQSMRNSLHDTAREHVEVHSIADLISDIKSLGAFQLKLKEIEFHIDLDEKLAKTKIKCKKIQVSQVLLNLLTNALHAVEGGRDPWIKLKTFVDGESVVFQMTDSGPGIPEENQEKVFIPLFSTKNAGEGTGLGLSIAQEMVHKALGTLILNTKVSNNCFEVRLPL